MRKKSLQTLDVKIPVASLTPTRTNDAFQYTFTVYVASSGLRGVSPISRRAAKFSILVEDAGRPEARFFTYELGLVTDKAVKLVAIGIVDEATKNYGLATVDLRADQSAIAER